MVRAALHPNDPGIRWNGIQMWRGAVDWPVFDGGDSMVIAGDAVAKLVLYPIAPGNHVRQAVDQLGNLCARRWCRYANAGAGKLVASSQLRDVPASGGAVAPAVHRMWKPLIRTSAEIFEYPMCDRDPLPSWTSGRVTLLGDAAHPMYPVGSNGASQAILDARCLAGLLVTVPVGQALTAYEQGQVAGPPPNLCGPTGSAGQSG